MRLSSALLAGLCLTLAACGGSGSASPPQPSGPTGPTGPTLAIVLPSPTMISGTTMQASATLGGSAASNVTWRSSDATVAAVSADGTLTGTRAGIATITAIAGNASGSTTVRVEPGAPAELSVYRGDGQTALVLSPLADPLCTLVRDAAGNVVRGATVTYTVATGGGVLQPPTSPRSDDVGVAVSGSWSLGDTKGQQTVIATSGSAPPLTFRATGM